VSGNHVHLEWVATNLTVPPVDMKIPLSPVEPSNPVGWSVGRSWQMV